MPWRQARPRFDFALDFDFARDFAAGRALVLLRVVTFVRDDAARVEVFGALRGDATPPVRANSAFRASRAFLRLAAARFSARSFLRLSMHFIHLQPIGRR